MFIVEQHGPDPVNATSPEEAVLKVIEGQGGCSFGQAHFNVWDTLRGTFYIIKHMPDWDPTSSEKEFQRVVQLDQGTRELLVEEMMYRAHSSDSELRKICQMAAAMVRSKEECQQWLEESDETEP